MRVPKRLYDGLKMIERNEGFTKDIEMDLMDDLVSFDLVTEYTNIAGQYRFLINGRGQAALEDRPINP